MLPSCTALAEVSQTIALNNRSYIGSSLACHASITLVVTLVQVLDMYRLQDSRFCIKPHGFCRLLLPIWQQLVGVNLNMHQLEISAPEVPAL